MEITTTEMITLRGLMGPLQVFAYRYGAWAVHEIVEMKGRWAITLAHTGMSLPYTRCCFANAHDALEAAKEIARLRNDWDWVSASDLKGRGLLAQITAIAQRHNAIEGPVQMRQPVDRAHFSSRVI